MLIGDDRSQINEQKAEEMMVEDAYIRRGEVIDNLTYNNYRWQRHFYKIAAERLAPHFPRAATYERMYQEELARAA